MGGFRRKRENKDRSVKKADSQYKSRVDRKTIASQMVVFSNT